MTRALRIDAFFDFICPWCLIGKRQLNRALAKLRASHPEIELELVWHGVQLLPHLPAQGVPFVEFYQKRLGSAEAVQARQAQVRQAAAAVGLSIDFSSIKTMPNTADAHRLLECATGLGSVAQRDALLEQLFAAYFHRGKDLADSATLLAIAESCGYPRAALADCLLGARCPFDDGGMGARGVPYFLFNRRQVVSGAQPAEVLLQAMHQALAQDVTGSQSA
ncbi:DsbA family oxidoreductase [Pseudomonas sp. BF-R-19]|uniref:DsbA family oxidoreductase n=1 Tax=Pseudomonas sp. BF-R-19 TaxID=2832397 RepID=UPI001CBC0A9D|nr:DsbA family oxidoreductase [Pseudomonas sp. BF-R-19]